MKKNCELCGNEFESKTKAKFCSEECKVEIRKQKQRQKHKEKLNKKFENKIVQKEYVVCKICGLKSRSLDTHLNRTHKMSNQDYYSKFNCDKHSIYCDDYLTENSDRIKGENNPGYQHNGKFSPFSENFIKGTDKIEETKQKAKQSRIDNNGINTKIEYYTSRGFAQEEAEQKLKERQTTFTKEKCIEKHGETEGLKVWQERQDKWQDTLNSKTDEELGEINKKKQVTFSKIADEFFRELREELKHLNLTMYFGSNNGETTIGKHLPDFCIHELNFVIEYIGNFWHANPNIYESDYYNKASKKYAHEIWDRDAKRQQYFKDRGYDVFVVWEEEHSNNKKEIINKYVKLIKEKYESSNIFINKDIQLSSR